MICLNIRLHTLRFPYPIRLPRILVSFIFKLIGEQYKYKILVRKHLTLDAYASHVTGSFFYEILRINYMVNFLFYRRYALIFLSICHGLDMFEIHFLLTASFVENEDLQRHMFFYVCLHLYNSIYIYLAVHLI